jgi:hypothetical protein
VRLGCAEALCGLLVALTMGRPLGAQGRSILDVGFSAVRFLDDGTTVVGPSAGLIASAERGRLFGQVNVGGVGTFGAATGSASFEAGARAPVWRAWLVEGAGELSGVAGTSSRSAATAIAAGRVLRILGPGGGWARVTGSMARREAGNLPGQSVEVGGWWSFPRARLTASLLEQHAQGQLFSGPFRELLVGTVPVRYAEGSIGLHVESARRSFDMSVGTRRDPDAARLFEPVVNVSAAVWQSETRAWTVAFSQTPPDFVRGADAARWVAVGMRFNEPTPSRARSARIQPVVQLIGAGDSCTVRVRAPGARQVELMADFTEWSPVTLTATPAGFEYSGALARGSHRLVVRLDGGPWRPAANTPAVDDDLGGRVGLLVVR